MNEFEKINYLMRLKEVYRQIPLKGRSESTAEHTWGMMILADYFLQRIQEPLNKEKVYDLITYHDLVEIEAGDVDFLDTERKKGKKENESVAVKKMRYLVPPSLTEKFTALHREYANALSREAEFVKAIDKLEPAIQVINNKKIFRERNFSREEVWKSKEPYLKKFPELLQFAQDLMNYFDKEGYYQRP